MIVSVIGLGLMGGSFSLALKRSDIASKVVGFDSSENNAKEALRLGLIDEIGTLDNVTKSDLLVLAVPVEACVSILCGISLSNPDITIIDLGSTKEKISIGCPVSIRPNLVASHPMTGTEYSGPSAAFVDLYKNKTVVLCDLDLTAEKHKKIAVEIFEKLEMHIVQMSSKVHDRHASFISHLPHLLSFSLANTVLSQESPEAILTLAAGGFKDMSRLAKSSPSMWREIFSQNRLNMLGCIESFKKELEKFENAIQQCDEDALSELMKHANGLYGIFR